MIRLIMIRYRGQWCVLGRNQAVRMLLKIGGAK